MKLHWSGALRSHALTTMRWLGVLRIHLALKAKPRAQNIGYACIWRAHACRECCKINLQIDGMAKSCGYARLLCRGTIFAVAFDMGTHGNPVKIPVVYYIILYYIILYYTILYYIILYYIILYFHYIRL